MKLTMEIPEMVAVVDTTNYKGSPETVLAIAGVPILYYKGRGSAWPKTNEDWEELIKIKLSHALSTLLLMDELMSENWQENPYGGRDVDFDPVIDYVREDYS